MKVFEAMPVDQFDYRPHARSPSAPDLVWTLANEMAACTTMIDSGEVRWDPPPAALSARPTSRIVNGSGVYEPLPADWFGLGAGEPIFEHCGVYEDLTLRRSRA